MRLATLLTVACSVLTVTVAGAQTQVKKDETRISIGYAFQQGEIYSPLALEGDTRTLNGIGYLFVEAYGEKSRIRGETTALGGFQGLQLHNVSAHASLFSVLGISLDTGFEVSYFEQPVTVFEHGRTEIRGNHKQWSGLFSVMTGIGTYRNSFVRGGIVGGLGYIEHSLDLYVDGRGIRPNRSSISSGIPILYGLRIEAGTYIFGLHLEARATKLLVSDVPSYVLDDQIIFSGTISYRTPWHIGVYAKSTTSTGNPSFLFLNNSYAAGVMFSYP